MGDEYYTWTEGPVGNSGSAEFVRPQPSTNEEFSGDLKKYDRALKVARFCGFCCTWESESTFYTFYDGWLPMMNPCNFVGIKTWCCSLFGVSKDFWDNVLTPYHAFNEF